MSAARPWPLPETDRQSQAPLSRCPSSGMLAGPLAAGLVPALLMLRPCNSMADANQKVWLCNVLREQTLIFEPICNGSMVALPDLCAVDSVLCDYSTDYCACIVTLCVTEIDAALRNVCYMICSENVRCSGAASIDLPWNVVTRTLCKLQGNFQGNKKTCVPHDRASVWLELVVYLAVSSML